MQQGSDAIAKGAIGVKGDGRGRGGEVTVGERQAAGGRYERDDVGVEGAVPDPRRFDGYQRERTEGERGVAVVGRRERQRKKREKAIGFTSAAIIVKNKSLLFLLSEPFKYEERFRSFASLSVFHHAAPLLGVQIGQA